jgi:putative transposase
MKSRLSAILLLPPERERRPLVFMLVAAATLMLLLVTVIRHFRRRPRFLRRPLPPPPDVHPFGHKKPEWVCNEVIRLRALMPADGCRMIAAAFNSLHAKKGERVSKTYVADTLKRHAAAVLVLRRKLRNRPLRQGVRKLTWAMDLTYLGRDRPVLGLIDHGTRALLSLRVLRDRSTLGILRVLLDAIEKFGRPVRLRTDNEGIFRSYLMRVALLLLGIRPQPIDPFCPWQNGRIERFFGTLKQRLRQWWAQAGVPNDVQPDLDILRTWYNHARTHQSLAGLTPAMAWAGIARHTKRPRFFTAWDGLLTGFVSRS